MILKKTPLILVTFVLWACANDSDPSRDAIGLDSHDEIFSNPVFECASENVVEPGEGYPHPLQQFPRTSEPERSVAQLKDFCAKMQERFAESGLTATEAQRIYDTIPSVLNIIDESYEMPSPDQPPLPSVDLTSRVMLRKLSEGRYELFYFTIGCGRQYFHYELVLTDSQAEVRELESWSEAFPC